MKEPDVDFPVLRKAIDSTMMLLMARFLMPTVVAITGYFAVSTLDDLKQANIRFWMQIGKVSEAQAANNTTVGVLTAKIDGAGKQLDRLQSQVDNLARR